MFSFLCLVSQAMCPTVRTAFSDVLRKAGKHLVKKKKKKPTKKTRKTEKSALDKHCRHSFETSVSR